MWARFATALKSLLVLIVLLTTWRLSIPSLKTSPEALASFRNKVGQIQQAHANRVPMQFHFSDIELNSEIDDWYRRMHIDVGWPPWGTVLRFKGNHAHAYIPARFMPANVRVALADVI